jgi:pyruvate,orthophosphate dikinase
MFAEGSAEMRDLLGGKGAGVAEMTRAGLPVPPGFTITTEACREYYRLGKRFPDGLWEQVITALGRVEEQLGQHLGDPDAPLLVSVRSGAKLSMPGMMDTVLNLGLNEKTLLGLARITGNERFAYDAYRRLIQMYGRIVLEIPGERFEHALAEQRERAGVSSDADLSIDDLRAVTEQFLAIVRAETKRPFPTDPLEQLRQAIEAVFRSWMGRRAVDYREFHRIPHDLGTAVNVQAMVFGNLGADSATGVCFTRDPNTGANRLYGEYLPNAQGEDVVAGIRTPHKVQEMERELPAVYRQLAETARRLERHYRDMQDIEFTIERGKLWLLQTRTGQRTAQAAVKIAVDLHDEGLITREEAVGRVRPDQLEQLLHRRIDPSAPVQPIARGLNASPGAAAGRAVFDPDRAQELGRTGQRVILVRPETSPDDVHGMLVAEGILTARGGATSHAAVVARGLGKPCVAGCEVLNIDLEARRFSVDGTTVAEGDLITIDGGTGEVFLGEVPTIEPEWSAEMHRLLAWADDIRRLEVWANADYPRDARKARDYGAQGIGLCRTEHMFFEADRLPIVRDMILAAPEAAVVEGLVRRLEQDLSMATGERREQLAARLAEARRRRDASPAVQRYQAALQHLEKVQREDFKGLLRVMDGLPVIIRLLDPPLHEFLPRYEELLVEVAELRHREAPAEEIAAKEQLLHAVATQREANPMLGLRGCRLGVIHPAIYAMQVRAIVSAAIDVQGEGIVARPEIMIPLVAHVNELRTLRADLERVAEEVQRAAGVRVAYKFGTMIEVPRAAITAGEIAEVAEFFSFGTNDLTQMTYGISRDDAEPKFLLQYVERKMLPQNPFQTLDQKGVGELMRWAVERGRATRPDLEVGICGEHGGDPASIAFCHDLGLHYVSCSPYRVPVARLAAAHAALGIIERDR